MKGRLVTSRVRELFPLLRVRAGAGEVEGPPRWEWGRRLGDDGIFAEWSVEGGRVTARVDRLGMAPLFYAAGPGWIVLSPNALRVAGAIDDRSLDDEAMAVFVRRGYFVGEDTPWRAVRAMPPGGRLEWSAGGLRVTGSVPIVPEARTSLEEATDAYIEAFRRSIARCVESGRSVVPLSGGRDSRHILLELCRQGRAPSACVTVDRFVREDRDDTAVASWVASRAGVAHEIVRYRRSWTAYELRKNLRCGFCSDEHNYYMVLADAVEGRFDRGYDGIGGDVLSAPYIPAPEHTRLFEQGRYEELAREMLSPRPGTRAYELWKPVASEEACEWILTRQQRRRWTLDRAVARVARELSRHAGAARPIDSFLVMNRTRREIALGPYAVLRGLDVVHAPYLDREVFDLLSSLPAPGLIGQDFHDRAIARAFPECADIPYSVGPGEGRFRSSTAENLRWLGRLVLHTAWGCPRRLRRVAAYARHWCGGGPRGRCGRAMVVFLNQFEEEEVGGFRGAGDD